MKKLSTEVPLTNKRVLVRCNFDVPIDNGTAQDTTRIEDAIATLRLLREQNAQVILLAHAGRPEGYQSDLSLAPIKTVLESLLREQVELIDYQGDYHNLNFNAPISLVENLRFWPEEEANDPDFAQFFASQADLYINEAFANCHRAHASIVGIPQYIESYAGISLAREIEILSKVMSHPDRPFVMVIGGAKLETKEPLVTAFANRADTILVGGKITQDLAEKHLNLPPTVKLAELVPSGKDITVDSAQEFAAIIMQAQTVVWNGSMGMCEDPAYQEGTRIVAQALTTTPGFTIVGGGDTETALTMFNLIEGIDYISTGGGAMLTYLSEGSLIGIEALQ